MTIAVNLKVNDGVVLASDSATTLVGGKPDAFGVVNVYEHANKIVNLRKGLPIGCLTWGAGSIGPASVAAVLRDLRQDFSDPESSAYLDPSKPYELLAVAEHLRVRVLEARYPEAFGHLPPEQQPQIGFVVAGYSKPGRLAEEYVVQVANGVVDGPRAMRPPEQSGVTWNGEVEPLHRLLIGFSPHLPNVLGTDLGVPEGQIPQAVDVLRARLAAPLVHPAMPIQDAIDLARFLVDLTMQWSRFHPGATTVGGPIELAAITRHESFKWVSRKHYFDRRLNPDEPRT